MKTYSIKLTDGTRYDFTANNLEYDEDGYMMIKGDDKRILLNGRYIVTITIKGESDDSKTIS